MSYMEAAYERQYEYWMEQEREWYDNAYALVHCDGWTMVKIKSIDTSQLVSVSDWCKENIKKSYDYHVDEFVFESAEEALLFSLRWA